MIAAAHLPLNSFRHISSPLNIKQMQNFAFNLLMLFSTAAYSSYYVPLHLLHKGNASNIDSNSSQEKKGQMIFVDNNGYSLHGGHTFVWWLIPETTLHI